MALAGSARRPGGRSAGGPEVLRRHGRPEGVRRIPRHLRRPGGHAQRRPGPYVRPLVQNVDADDELEPGALAALATALSDHPDAGYAVGHARDLMGDGLLIDHPLPVLPGLLPRGALLPAWRTTPTDYRVPVHPAGVMWRRSLLLALGGWSALQGMEDTGVLMAASAVTEGVLVDSATLRYRRHAAQMSKQTSKFAGGGADSAHPATRGGAELNPVVEPHP